MRHLLVAMLLLAGCAAPDAQDTPSEAGAAGDIEPPSAPTRPSSPAPEPWLLSYAECEGIEVIQVLPAEAVSAWMPPGFTPTNVIADVPGTATLVTQVGHCGEADLNGASLNGTGAQGFAIVTATPPHNESAARIHAIALAFVVGNATEEALLREAGLSTVRVGSASTDIEIVGNVATGTATLDGAPFTAQHQATGPVSTSTGYRVRFYDPGGGAVFDAVLESFDVATGPGIAVLGGTEPPAPGPGLGVVRLADGPFVSFEPVN